MLQETEIQLFLKFKAYNKFKNYHYTFYQK